MDYKKHYNTLIDRARIRILEGYSERHHIIPRCVGGSDDDSNLVRLTPEEHYVAHQLLIKIYPGNSALINAAVMMIVNRPSNKLYGWLRRKHSELQSNRQKGSGNTQYGSRWIHNIDLEQNKKINKSAPLPEGWIEGRKIKFDLLYHSCKTCQTKFKRLGLEVYCSEICKKHDKSESNRIIDNNLDAMLEYYQNVWSIDKTLKHFGVKGNRAGNAYFSQILKKNNMYVRKRRNSIT